MYKVFPPGHLVALDHIARYCNFSGFIFHESIMLGLLLGLLLPAPYSHPRNDDE